MGALPATIILVYMQPICVFLSASMVHYAWPSEIGSTPGPVGTIPINPGPGLTDLSRHMTSLHATVAWRGFGDILSAASSKLDGTFQAG